MAGAKAIKQLLIERKMTVKSLAEMLGIEPQSMRNKLYRDTFSHAEIIKIAQDQKLSDEQKTKKINALEIDILKLKQEARKIRMENTKEFESILTADQKAEFALTWLMSWDTYYCIHGVRIWKL